MGAGRLLEAADGARIDIRVATIGESPRPATVAGRLAGARTVVDGPAPAIVPASPTKPGRGSACARSKRRRRWRSTERPPAVVTGPVAKAELAAVGFAFPGQTEFVAAACGVAAEDAVMMLAGPRACGRSR